MDELCTACHCSGRRLFYISETKFESLYSQIINEIPLHNMTDLGIRICWECKALLRKMDEFKEQVKRCYTELLHYVLQNTSKPLPVYPRLQAVQVHTSSYPVFVKEEFTEGMNGDINIGADDDDLPVYDLPINHDDGFEVKNEDTHCEPETFVKDWDLEDVKKKKGTKKTLKEKSKKKQKIKKEKEVKSKVKKKSTLGSIIDSTVAVCYNKVDGKTKIEKEINTEVEEKKNIECVEEKNKENEEEKNTDTEDRIDEPTELEDTGENVDILVRTTSSYKINKRTPKKPSPHKQVTIKESLSEKPVCAECGKTFSSRKTYKYHINVLHKGQNRHPCPRCGKVYQWKSNLGRHLRSHKARDSDELYCEKCDKRFASVATYRQHLRISRRHVSESEFSFICTECGKKFVNKTRLRDHVDWEHLKKIKFKCQKCNKAFKCHTSLYVHMQNVHCAKDQKLNLCHVCGKSYQNAAKLKYHIVAMHTSETPYQCQQCGAAFGWYSSLYRHVREVHYRIKHQPKKSKKQKKSEVLPSLLPMMAPQLMLQPVHQPGPA